MSVIVKNMEMPKSCYECNLKIICDYASMNGWISNKRDSMCPLIEVKTPHGRLGNLDKLKADCSMKDDCAECEKELQGSSRACEYDRIYSKMDFCQWIDNAETVIEAEGSE